MAKLAVETTPVMEETYPEVPRPLTVEASWVSRKVVETKLAKLAVETTPVMEETYPEVPRPLTVDAN